MLHDPMEDIMDRVFGRFYGKYRGEVKTNEDEANLGRLKVKVQAVLGDLEVWAMPCVPYAGDGVGFHSLPGKGAGVWIEFEGGDPTYPIWTGCYWRSGEIPDEAGPKVHVWRTEKATLLFDDDADSIEMTNSQNASLVLDDALTGTAGAGQVEVTTSGVTSTAGGAGKLEVGVASVSLNSGAMEVT